jgi:hypothetical protein
LIVAVMRFLGRVAIELRRVRLFPIKVGSASRMLMEIYLRH